MIWPIRRKKYWNELAVISSQINGRESSISKLCERVDNLATLLQRTNEKIDVILEILEKRFKSSSMEKKRKEEILSILKNEKTLSIYKLSELMGLSRTRCNELLNSLENEGMVKSLRIGKKKVYTITESLAF